MSAPYENALSPALRAKIRVAALRRLGATASEDALNGYERMLIAITRASREVHRNTRTRVSYKKARAKP